MHAAVNLAAAAKKKSTLPKLPLVMVHVRLTGVGVPLEHTEPLRDALIRLVDAYAVTWGLRVKRRRITIKDGVELYAKYEARAKLHAMIE